MPFHDLPVADLVKAAVIYRPEKVPVQRTHYIDLLFILPEPEKQVLDYLFCGIVILYYRFCISDQ